MAPPPPDSPSSSPAIDSATAAAPARPSLGWQQNGAVWLVIGIVLLGGVVRWEGCLSQFWLDEIWSLMFSQITCHSPTQIFTNIHHDNNHYLNTLYMYFLGVRTFWPVYRIPSLVAGVASIAVAAGIAQRYARTAAVFAALLMAASYPLIHYSSEARGYAPAWCLLLLGFWLLRRFLERPTLPRGLGFGTVIALALLSNLSAALVVAALGCWSCWRLFRRYQVEQAVSLLLQAYAIPILLLTLLYLVDLRHLIIGGGDQTPLLPLLSGMLAGDFGLSDVPPLGALLALGLLALLAAQVRDLLRRRDDEWVFYVMALVGTPALYLAVLRPSVVYPRYFICALPFLYLLLARALSGWYGKRLWRTPVLAFLACFILANAYQTYLLLAVNGRGHYMEGLIYMAQHTPGDTVVLSSDSDDRATIEMYYYQNFMPPGKKLLLISAAEDAQSHAAEWYLVHTLAHPATIPPDRLQLGHAVFRQVERCGTGELSGFMWWIYQRMPDETIPHTRTSPTNGPKSATNPIPIL